MLMAAGTGLLLLLSATTALAQTATPPEGKVVPNFDGLDVMTDDTSLDVGAKVQKKNGEAGESAIKGSIQGTTGKGTKTWAGGSLGYLSAAGDLYGIYTSSDVLFEGNTYLSAVYVEKILALTSEIIISAPDISFESGDVHVQDGDFDVQNGGITAQSIGAFYVNEEYSTDYFSVAYCDTGDQIISCGGFSADTSASNPYFGSYIQTDDGCIAKRYSSATDGTAKIRAEAFCFNPDGK